MANSGTHNTTDTQKRRLELQKRRNLKFAVAMGRSLVLLGMSYGLFWLISLPKWVITSSSQLEVLGNRRLSLDTVKSLTGLSYPQSLWELPTQDLRNQLKNTPPIADAAVMRRLLPPGLTIEIEEREPVAVVLSNSDPNQKTLAPIPVIGFLDRQGVFIAYKYYNNPDSKLKTPKLKIIGFTEQNKIYWAELYTLVSQSPLDIYQIDWRDPNNLILKTSLGIVYLGANHSLLAKQFTALNNLSQLPSEINPDQILYLDLNNPDAPLINLVKIPEQKK